ncbi:DUF1707 domain-containing protein [Streptosporangium sp. NPDC000095]|uniref:DUF1707 SHOCT-like domain-containing protein n=1 Tax=Streptosporangium sp. NPDC000095 TaxID=3366184 RepID=UPI0036CBB7F7
MTNLDGRLRASHSDRDAVIERLRVATGEGRLSLEELEERIERTQAARTYDDLRAITADLPRDDAGLAMLGAGGAGGVGSGVLELQTKYGAVQQKDYWVVPARIVASCGSGSVKIDFTGAVCSHREVLLEATCGMGNILVIVPRGWTVRIDSLTTNMGTITNKATEPGHPDAPVLRVTGKVGLGTLKIKYPRR